MKIENCCEKFIYKFMDVMAGITQKSCGNLFPLWSLKQNSGRVY